MTPEVSTLPETNSSPLKIDGWETSFLLGWPFSGATLVLGMVILSLDSGSDFEGIFRPKGHGRE